MDVVVKVSSKGVYLDKSNFEYIFPDITYKNGTKPDIVYIWSGF